MSKKARGRAHAHKRERALTNTRVLAHVRDSLDLRALDSLHKMTPSRTINVPESPPTVPLVPLGDRQQQVSGHASSVPDRRLRVRTYLATVTATPPPFVKGSTVWITPLPKVRSPTNIARSFSLQKRRRRHIGARKRASNGGGDTSDERKVWSNQEGNVDGNIPKHGRDHGHSHDAFRNRGRR